MNARDIMIRIFAKGGAAAATEFQKPARAAEDTGRALDGTANKSESNSRRVVTHAQQMRRAFTAVAASAVIMGGRVQSGTATGAQGVAVMTRQVERLDRAMQRAKDQADKFGNVKGGFQQAGTAGMVASGAAAGGAYVIGRGLGLAGQKELELKSIEAFEGSKGKADSIYKEIDGMSTTSVFELTDLTAAGKSLSKNRMFDKRYLTASDDLAAANKADGVDPNEVARVYGRLKSGDFGEAWERARDFGISKSDLEAQGAKFSKSNEFQGTSEEAIEFFTRAIEAKFKGLSEKLATETMAGALSNLADAGGRAATSISEELIPAVTTGTRWLTAVAGVFSNLPSPVRKFLAFGGVLGVVLLGAVGAGLMLVSMLGQAALGWLALSGSMATGTGLTAALTGATTAQAGAAGTATIGTQALATSMLSRLVPAILTSMGVIALAAIAIVGFTVALDGMKKGAEQSDEELKKHWSGLGGFWVAASDALTKLMSHPLFKILSPVGSYLFGAQNEDPAHDRKLYETEIARRKKFGHAGADEDFATWDAKRKNKHNKMSDNDKETSRGDNAELSEPAGNAKSNRAPGDLSNTPGMPSQADIEKQQKQAQELLAQQPATGMEALSAPTVNGMETGANGAAAMSSMGSRDSIRDLELRALNGEDVSEKLKRARYFEKWGNKDAAAARKAKRESEKNQHSEAIEAGISALGDGREDIDKLPQLHKQLREARRKKNTVEATILNERIARANEARSDTQKGESEQKRTDAKQRRVDAQLQKEWLEDQKVLLDAKVRSGQITKLQAEAMMRGLKRDAKHRELGMETTGAEGLAGLRGASMANNSQATPISPNEAKWLGYARQSVGQMSKDDAFKFINKQSAYFENGGFNGEGEMAAWQRAYMEKYGAANFKNSMFAGGLGENRQSGALGGLTDFLSRGGSLRNWKAPKPGDISGAANPLSFDSGAGDASPTAGGENRPRNKADQLLTVRGTQKVIQQGTKRIIRTIVPDLVLEDSFAHAVTGVRRR